MICTSPTMRLARSFFTLDFDFIRCRYRLSTARHETFVLVNICFDHENGVRLTLFFENLIISWNFQKEMPNILDSCPPRAICFERPKDKMKHLTSKICHIRSSFQRKSVSCTPFHGQTICSPKQMSHV